MILLVWRKGGAAAGALTTLSVVLEEVPLVTIHKGLSAVRSAEGLLYCMQEALFSVTRLPEEASQEEDEDRDENREVGHVDTHRPPAVPLDGVEYVVEFRRHGYPRKWSARKVTAVT